MSQSGVLCVHQCSGLCDEDVADDFDDDSDEMVYDDDDVSD